MSKEIETLQSWIDESRDIVFFSGAGMSHESGIPDFRRIEENYFRTYEHPPDAILSRAFLERRPGPFFRFWRERVLAPLITAEPNAAHRKLVELESAGKLRMILTQNMDDLHQEAGSKKVLELCGNVMRNDCPLCDQHYSALAILEKPGIPYCDVDMCGGVMTPSVVLQGDAYNNDLITDAIFQILSADLFIVAGTSMLASPAVALLYYYSRKKMVLINQEPTVMDGKANLVINAPICEVMGQLSVSGPN